MSTHNSIRCFPGGLTFRKPANVTYCFVSGHGIEPVGKEKPIFRKEAAILMRAVYRALQIFDKKRQAMFAE